MKSTSTGLPTPHCSSRRLLPRGASRYTFNPQKTGVGWIAAELSADHLADTLRVRVGLGKPLWASLQLLTPENRRIAGDTLLIAVKIYNRPGLVEGDYCFPSGTSDSVSYLDSLGTGGRSSRPVAIVDDRVVRIVTPQNSRGATGQCFHEGIDTIAVILYYAPAATDSLHRLRFVAGDSHRHRLRPFRKCPRRSFLTLECHRFITRPRRYGCTLPHQIHHRIDLTLSLPVTISDAAAVARGISLDYNGATLTVDSVAAGRNASEIRILLREPSTPTQPQTGWTPRLSFDNTSWDLDGAADSLSIVCDDGAGPVIWSVTKELVNADNRAQDRVTVVFSERVYGSDGRKLPLSQSPEKLFDVWVRDGSRGYKQQPVLAGITGLYEVVSPDTMIFTMKNGNDLTSFHYLSIHCDSASTAPLTDLPALNVPPQNNHKVKVQVSGNPAGDLLIGPNPMRPTARRQAPGKFSVRHNGSTIDWVQQDHAGTAFQFKIALPDDKKLKISGKIIIYDFVGNRVAADPVSHLNPKGMFRDNEGLIMDSEPCDNIIPASWVPDGSVYDYFIYWNGYTLGGVPAAPGIYRVVLKLVITTSKGKETRIYTNTVGVKQ